MAEPNDLSVLGTGNLAKGCDVALQISFATSAGLKLRIVPIVRLFSVSQEIDHLNGLLPSNPATVT